MLYYKYTNFVEKICVFLTLSIFFVKCVVARSFKAFLILTSINKHIFKKINTCIIKKTKSSFQVSIDFWVTSEGLHASDSLSFSNFGIIETHERESVDLIELKGYLYTCYGVAMTRIYQVMVLP